MSLNIKNPEAHELAKELAELTGESMTDAVVVALRERLRRVRNSDEHVHARKEAILAMGREIASRMSEETRTMDINEYLYDERGLPR
jgi:antitoxin VapB